MNVISPIRFCIIYVLLLHFINRVLNCVLQQISEYTRGMRAPQSLSEFHDDVVDIKLINLNRYIMKGREGGGIYILNTYFTIFV